MVSRFNSWLLRIGTLFFWMAFILLLLYVPLSVKWLRTSRSINVMTWPELIDPIIISQFERETGIKVYVSYFSNNEELYVKMKATNGHGYDLLIPSDYTIALLMQDGLLKKLDQSKISSWHDVAPGLRNAYYDPQNEYTMPYVSQIYGLGIDTTVVPSASIKDGWGLIFNHQQVKGKVGMAETPRENILLAAHYLFGTIDNLSSDQLDKIEALLLAQKKWVEAYTEMRADYLLLSHICPIILSSTPVMFKAMQENKSLDFIIPQGGTFMVVDAFVIPQVSEKDFLVYEFINYLCSADRLEYHFKKYRFFPATKNIQQILAKYGASQSIIESHSYNEIDYFRNTISESIISDMWIRLKSK